MNTIFQTGKERHRKEVTLYPRGWGLLPPAPQVEELRAEETPAIKVTEQWGELDIKAGVLVPGAEARE